MSLNNRALLLIFPVVLAGYLLAAGSAYLAQKSSLLRLEQARLTQRLQELQSSFERYLAFDKGLLYAIADSSALSRFLSESDARYRSEALGIRIQDSIKSLSDESIGFVAFAIFRPDATIDYYYENGADPFAEMPAAQSTLARAVIAGPELASSDYVLAPEGRALVVASVFVQPGALDAPLLSQKHRSHLVQVAVQPDRFLALKRTLEAEYGAAVELAPWPLQADEGLSEVVGLGAGRYARLTPSVDYLWRHLSGQRLMLGLGSLTMSLISVGILLLLVRRYITAPVSILDSQLTEVMEGRRAAIPAPVEGGEIGRLCANMKTLHDSVAASLRQVQEVSWTDAMTGISNRARFNILSAAMVEEAERAGSELTLLFFDLDNFKWVNDKYGHEHGDALLKAVAVATGSLLARLADERQEALPLFARLSGDEFAIVVRSGPAGGMPDAIAASILSLFKDGFRVDGQTYPVTASIGMAVSPQDAADVAQLMAGADAAMYQAKAAGKNKLAWFSQSLAETSRLLRLIEEELKTLDPAEEFRLVYMPIIDATGDVVACEALLRWRSPLLGEIPPARFVPIAESQGLFAKIDHWVIDRAMADYGRLSRLFGDDVLLAINISSAELYTRSIEGYLADRAKAHDVDISRIEIELTETFATGLTQQTREVVQALRDRGFRVTIDDFGVGYTSIQQILEYPADTIKLDRAIVERLTGPGCRGSLRSIIDFCHAQRMTVTAEGVDHPAKLEMLRDARCDFFQGFGISSPLRLDDLARWQAQRGQAPTGSTCNPVPEAVVPETPEVLYLSRVA